MSITLTKAMQKSEEGKLAHQDSTTLCPYKKNTSEHYWWAKGWMKEHNYLQKRITNAKT